MYYSTEEIYKILDSIAKIRMGQTKQHNLRPDTVFVGIPDGMLEKKVENNQYIMGYYIDVKEDPSNEVDEVGRPALVMYNKKIFFHPVGKDLWCDDRILMDLCGMNDSKQLNLKKGIPGFDLERSFKERFKQAVKHVKNGQLTYEKYLKTLI